MTVNRFFPNKIFIFNFLNTFPKCIPFTCSLFYAIVETFELIRFMCDHLSISRHSRILKTISVWWDSISKEYTSTKKLKVVLFQPNDLVRGKHFNSNKKLHLRLSKVSIIRPCVILLLPEIRFMLFGITGSKI